MGNTMPSLITSVSRIMLIAIPVIVLSRLPGFELKTIWYLSASASRCRWSPTSLLLRREFQLRFAPQLATDQPSLSS